MKLVSFTVEKYRSINSAKKITTSDLTILIGPNNEGKSNILRALVAAMSVLTRGRQRTSNESTPEFHVGLGVYDWEQDFPHQLQDKKPNGKSVVILEFGLTSDEVAEFRSEIRSNLNGSLPLKVVFGRDQSVAKVTVAKQGPGAKSLALKSGKICRFVSRRLRFQQIPAVRTASSAQRIVEDLVGGELASLEENDNYREALEEIRSLQEPLLEKVSASLKEALVRFLPNIKDVNITLSAEERYRAFRRACEIYVDDGVSTLLKHKGDGVQSLAALGIMRHASEQQVAVGNFVVAVEEPESHLHPNSIHELRDVLYQLSKSYQIVLTTHCPLFVNRMDIKSNILVSKHQANPAENIGEIRDALGVRASDNLRHAELVLLVEGESDQIALTAMISDGSASLAAALADGTLVLDSLKGGSKLAYKAKLVVDSICQVHCFMDYDISGRDAIKGAQTKGVLTVKDVTTTMVQGRRDTEIEDLYDPESYRDLILQDYSVDVRNTAFKGRKKWSDRVEALFGSVGKPWDHDLEAEIKHKVAELVASCPQQCMEAQHQGIIDALIGELEGKLDKST